MIPKDHKTWGEGAYRTSSPGRALRKSWSLAADVSAGSSRLDVEAWRMSADAVRRGESRSFPFGYAQGQDDKVGGMCLVQALDL